MPAHRARAFLTTAARSPASRDGILLLATFVLLAVVCPPLKRLLPIGDVTLTMTLFAAVIGTAAALLGVLAARLTADFRLGWLSMALGCYSLLTIPTTTIGGLAAVPIPAVSAVRLLLHGLVVVMLVLAVVAAPAPVGWRAAAAVHGGAAVVAAVAALGAGFPSLTAALTASQPLRSEIALAWTALALTVGVLAVRRREWSLWRVAAGIAIVGLAHVWQLGAAILPAAGLGLTFSGIRTLGLLVVLWGTSSLARQAVRRLDTERAEQEEELRLAELKLARTAERDHELRSGLAGLAGATSLLRVDRPSPQKALLGSVVASELDRLEDLLSSPIGTKRHAPRETTYAIAPVLDGLALLHTGSGMNLRMLADADLRGRGSPAMLAQVMSNLLGNAARHAPGSPVTLSATSAGDRIEIRVRDLGPGIPAGKEEVVFEPGTCDDRTGGSGMGLGICRDLLAAEGGTIEIERPGPGSRGCSVVVRVPAVRSPRSRSRSDSRCIAS